MARLVTAALGLCTLVAGISPLQAQAAPLPPPAPGMAIRWTDAHTGDHEGTITAIEPTGTFVVDERIGRWETTHGLALDPAAARGVEVRVVHVSHRTTGALVGMVVGGALAALAISAHPGSGSLADLNSDIARAGVEFTGGMLVGALVGGAAGGSETVWAPVGERISLRPLVSWSHGPAIGMQLRF